MYTYVRMYVYIHMCTYVCMYIHILVYMYIYASIHKYTTQAPNLLTSFLFPSRNRFVISLAVRGVEGTGGLY